MASVVETTAPAQATSAGAASQNSRADSNRTGRRGGRINQHQMSQVDGPRGGRRGGRGGPRGNRTGGDAHNRRRVSNATIEPSPPIPPPPGLGGGGSFGARLTEDAKKTEGEEGTKGTKGTEDEVEAEVCFICASPVVHNSVGPCNHRTCHICALRLRALYKTKACAHCRVSLHSTIFSCNVQAADICLLSW